LDTLREQLSGLGAQFAAAQEQAEQGTSSAKQTIEAIGFVPEAEVDPLKARTRRSDQ
jgi:hypothetical protein